MRRLVVSVLLSVDGYYAGPDDDLSHMPFEDAFNTHNLALLRDAETLVYGRRWFLDNWSAWSAVAADATSSERDREIARRVLAMDSILVSDTASIRGDEPWAAQTRRVARSEAVDLVRQLKVSSGGTVLMFASSTTWTPFMEAGLVDELIVLVGPSLMGSGSPVYQGTRTPLRLVSSRVLPGSQLVEIRYRASQD